MIHPFQHIRVDRRIKYLIVFLAGTLFLMLMMNAIGEPLNTQEAPYGIVSFEFAGSLEKAQAIMSSWGAQGMVRAAFIQGLDFLFPLVYSSAIGLGCVMASEGLQRRKWPLAGLGDVLAWGLWLAAGLDYLENIGLTALLFGAGNDGWAILAAICAVFKFLFIFFGMVYALYGLVVRLAIAKPVT